MVASEVDSTFALGSGVFWVMLSGEGFEGLGQRIEA